MAVIFWPCVVLSVVLVGLASYQLLYLRHFCKNSIVAIGMVVGQKPLKYGKGVIPLVRFHHGKRTIETGALVFDKNTVLRLGEKVVLKCLRTGKTKKYWDVRVFGKAGFGKRKTVRACMVMYGVAVVLTIAAVLSRCC